MKEAPAADTNCTFTINMSTSGQASMCPKLLLDSDSFVWQFPAHLSMRRGSDYLSL